jgi:Uma2 family endonuclease
MATRVRSELLTVDEFLAIDFGELKAELNRGVIHMMAGGTARHAQVQGNIFAALRQKLRGSGCRPYGPDMGVRTRDDSFRLPDVSVFCGKAGSEFDQVRLFDDPRVLVEVLSNGTARTDLDKKLPEYKALKSVDTVVFVDTGTERVRVVQRTGLNGWVAREHDEPADVDLPALGITLTHDEIFARD